jgi:hypothetical protein
LAVFAGTALSRRVFAIGAVHEQADSDLPDEEENIPLVILEAEEPGAAAAAGLQDARTA